MKPGITFTCPECGKEITCTHARQVKCKLCVEQDKLKKKEQLTGCRYSIFLRDEFKCVYCGKSSIEDGVRLVLDHITPYCITQDSSSYNLITACDGCNRVKAANVLPLPIYNRIINLNIKRNNGISEDKKKEIQKVLDAYYMEQKGFMPNYE